ncbi:MAG: glycosyltransferase family 2 protein [Dysgonamonadaceae bacterium]|jgi:glycosyltransferase involved in cell wall biosynthesis|nr:glycosyltransferase family 2 protein [Dysgonamonadaceae bacterium]
MENKSPQVSLIVSTYNRPDALNLCLQSIARQSVLPAEVIIGDDGSKEETRHLIESFQENFPVPLIHIWQEDEGFRLAMMRNKTVAASHYEYIIEIDGDLILHRDFVADHLHFARKGYYLKGGRVNLTEQLTDECCKTGKLPRLNLFSRGLLRRINALHCLALSSYFAPRYKKNKIAGLGCNMSFWKEDFLKINGYDEFFEGWGGEDYDFVSRMVNSGVKRLYLKFSGIVYHLWHNDLYMQNKEKNFDYYHDKRDKKAVWCEKGIDQYLK